MKVTLEDALSLLGKYVEERTPELAVFVTPSVSVADNRRGASQRSNQCADCCSTQKSVHKSGCRVAQHVSHTLFLLGDPSGCGPLIADTVSSTTGGLGHPLRGWRQNDALQVHLSLTA
jgi:hypothetical protein